MSPSGLPELHPRRRRDQVLLGRPSLGIPEPGCSPSSRTRRLVIPPGGFVWMLRQTTALELSRHRRAFRRVPMGRQGSSARSCANVNAQGPGIVHHDVIAQLVTNAVALRSRRWPITRPRGLGALGTTLQLLASVSTRFELWVTLGVVPCQSACTAAQRSTAARPPSEPSRCHARASPGVDLRRAGRAPGRARSVCLHGARGTGPVPPVRGGPHDRLRTTHAPLPAIAVSASPDRHP